MPTWRCSMLYLAILFSHLISSKNWSKKHRCISVNQTRQEKNWIKWRAILYYIRIFSYAMNTWNHQCWQKKSFCRHLCGLSINSDRKWTLFGQSRLSEFIVAFFYSSYFFMTVFKRVFILSTLDLSILYLINFFQLT